MGCHRKSDTRIQKMRFWLAFVPLILLSCSSSNTEQMDSIDWQGHRGARGHYPENTLPAFFYALDHGMNTLEMDVVISADSQVVVSHEPFFNEAICELDSLFIDSLPNNIYKLSFDQVRRIDCGSKANVDFPKQQAVAMTKPLLSDIIEATEEFALQANYAWPYYNIEIKSQPAWDGEYHPSVEVYAELLMKVAQEASLMGRLTVQSFDKRVLKYLKNKYPELSLALLVEDKRPPQEHLGELGFKPNIYSCHHLLVDKALVEFCAENEMSLIPWTVNDIETIKSLLDMGVDGIITDYPDLRAQYEEMASSL